MFVFHGVSTLFKKERNNFTIKNNGVKLKQYKVYSIIWLKCDY